MKKVKYIIMVAAFVLVVAGVANAGMLIPSNDNAKGHSKAPEKSPVISETEGGGWELDRVDFVHYAKPDNLGKPPRMPKVESCYKLMGVKWNNLPVNYVINPLNEDNLSLEFITNAISTSAEVWDTETSSELFNNFYTIDDTAQYGNQNFSNAIVFGNYPDENVIGVTSIWFTRKGKQIVEFDMLLNDKYVWGDADINPEVMDLQNIVTHELGHGVGLDDIYSQSCSAVTMYGYSTEGETSKRILEQDDVVGLQRLYGI